MHCSFPLRWCKCPIVISRFLFRWCVFGMLLVGAASFAADAKKLLAPGIDEFTRAYVAWDLKEFTAASEMFAKVCGAEPKLNRAFYWRGAAEFHRLLNLLGQKQDAATKKAASEAMSRAIEALEQALRLDPNDAESHILLSTIYGMSIAESPARALWLGKRVMDHRSRALALAPENERAFYLMGMSDYYAPELLGGKAEGLAFLLKAEQIYDAQRNKARDPLEPRWGYGSCLTFIGKTSQALGKPAQAEAYFRKALKLNPKDRLAMEGLENLKGAVKKER